MPDTRHPKQVLYSELSTGQRAPGGPRRRYKDNIRTSLKKSNINSSNWEATASQRPAWRNCLHKGATLHEESWRVSEKVSEKDESSPTGCQNQAAAKEREALHQADPHTSHRQHPTSMPTLQESLWLQNWPLQPSEDPQQGHPGRTIILDFE
ncbi:hypothetical protein ABVT39_003835 [Epinephelus coioides]